MSAETTPATDVPVIVVHSLAHARAALTAAVEADAEVALHTPPGAAAYAGAGYLKALVDAAAAAYSQARFTAVIDCDADAGLALGALRAGWRAVRFSGRDDVRAKLADIAAQHGAEIVTGAADTAPLDLLDVAQPAAACRAFLAVRVP